jgi:3-hydroxyacyl-[acyl-carrier-protein] dehydratase
LSIKLTCDVAAPLLAIDEVVRVDTLGITTKRFVSPSEPFFLGHFPTYPIFPGVFIIEAVNQAAICYGSKYVGRLRMTEIRSVRFFSQVLPGDVLECDCHCMVSPETELLTVDALCRCEARKVASVKLTYRMEKALDPQSRRD